MVALVWLAGMFAPLGVKTLVQSRYLAGVAQVDRAYFHPERRRHRLDDGNCPIPGDLGGIPGEAQPGRVVAPRPPKIGHEPCAKLAIPCHFLATVIACDAVAGWGARIGGTANEIDSQRGHSVVVRRRPIHGDRARSSEFGWVRTRPDFRWSRQPNFQAAIWRAHGLRPHRPLVPTCVQIGHRTPTGRGRLKTIAGLTTCRAAQEEGLIRQAEAHRHHASLHPRRSPHIHGGTRPSIC